MLPLRAPRRVHDLRMLGLDRQNDRVAELRRSYPDLKQMKVVLGQSYPDTIKRSCKSRGADRSSWSGGSTQLQHGMIIYLIVTSSSTAFAPLSGRVIEALERQDCRHIVYVS